MDPRSAPEELPAVLRAWRQRGQFRRLGEFEIFTLDVGPRMKAREDPLLVLHGFPTCSFDFRHILDDLSESRRVVLLDMLGFGLSEKPDLRYSIELQADVVVELVDQLGLERLALLTHDMGDTVGGELLARQMNGSWPVEITDRVVMNGSIYIERAHLSAGQQHLLSLPDCPTDQAPDETLLVHGLAGTMAEASLAARADLNGDAALICYRRGNTMLPRTIRYIEDRRQRQDRYTGAIERHPSPVSVIWGTQDPIAVSEMVPHFLEARPDARVDWLEGIGHYPTLEAPSATLDAIQRALG